MDGLRQTTCVTPGSWSRLALWLRITVVAIHDRIFEEKRKIAFHKCITCNFDDVFHGQLMDSSEYMVNNLFVLCDFIQFWCD